jgi:hypothetical protein
MKGHLVSIIERVLVSGCGLRISANQTLFSFAPFLALITA